MPLFKFPVRVGGHSYRFYNTVCIFVKHSPIHVWVICQEAHGSHRSPEKPLQINEYIWAKLWLYIYYKIGSVVQEEMIFKFRECTFAILLLSPNEKWCGLSIWTNLNPLYPRLLFAKFGWNWPSGSIEEIF